MEWNKGCGRGLLLHTPTLSCSNNSDSNTNCNRIPAIFLIPNVYQTENLIDWAKEGWYSERIDRSVVSGLPPTVRCDDDDDDDGGDDDDYDDINDDDYDGINDDDDDDDDDDDNNNDEGEEDDDFEDSSSDVSNSEESAITEQRIV